LSPRLLPEVENLIEFEELGLLTVTGLARPVKPLNVVTFQDPVWRVSSPRAVPWWPRWLRLPRGCAWTM
jgi:hypothetical protein